MRVGFPLRNQAVHGLPSVSNPRSRISTLTQQFHSSSRVPQASRVAGRASAPQA
jgi:hypothetical protein